jgi:hypothetical protein
MSKPEGIYVCVDYRVTDSRNGALIDDSAIKSLRVDFAPLPVGVKALLTFTGVAILPDGTPTMTWIRETLRGESEFPDQALAHLRERLNRDYAGMRHPLIVNILAVHGEKRFFGGFSNIASTSFKPLTEFGYVMQEVNEEFLFANGHGAFTAFADTKLHKMQSLLGTRPRSVKDHMKLLSIVNRRVAASDPSVSPFCMVQFINADESFSPATRTFAEGGEQPPSGFSMLLGGIDLTELSRQAQEAFQSMKDGKPFEHPTNEEMNEQLKRRP